MPRPDVTRSRPKVGTAYLGPLPPSYWETLGAVAEYPQAIASNFCRAAATDIALAASLGHISSVSPDGLTYGRTWRLTPEGSFALRNREDHEA